MTATAPAPSPLELGQPVVDVAKPDDDDNRFWSVTTLIDCLDKRALQYWAAEQTAIAALTSQDTWRSMRDQHGDDEAIKWLAGARFRTPKGQRTAADLGSDVHAACEHYVITGKRPAEGDTLSTGRILDREVLPFQPAYQAAEVTVYHGRHAYAGTCDGFLTLEGTRFIFDIKSTRKSRTKRGDDTKPYPEVALQLAAYRYAEMAAVWRPRRFEHYRRRYYLLGEEERKFGVPVPEVDYGLAIHVAPQHCEAWPVRCDKEIFEAFLYVQEAARWSFQTSRNVLAGQPLQPGPGSGEA